MLGCSSSGALSRSLAGFSLIELLVVMAVIAAIGGLAGPQFWQTYQRANERLTVIEYGQELTQLRSRLMKSSRSLVIPRDQLAGDRFEEQLPELAFNWSIAGNTELLLLPTGVTSGGSIDFVSPVGRQWRLKLAVLDGELSVEQL